MKKMIFVSIAFTFYSASYSQPTYTNGSSTCGLSAGCLSATCSNPDNASDGSNTTFATLTVNLGIACSAALTSTFSSQQPAHKFVGFFITGGNASQISSSITLSTYNAGGSLMETQSGAGLSIVQSGSGYLVQFETTTAFRSASITLDGLANVLSSINVYFGFSNSSLLPLNFTGFNYYITGDDLTLSWSTTREENNNHFIVERSDDGINYKSIGVVNASGSNSGTYQFKDKTRSKTVIFYRIKQEDISGQFSYSKIIIVKVDNSSRTCWLYPNPVKDEMTVGYFANSSTAVTIEILDLSGRILSKKQNLKAYIGNNVYTVNTNPLIPGIYSVRITNTASGDKSIIQICKIN